MSRCEFIKHDHITNKFIINKQNRLSWLRKLRFFGAFWTSKPTSRHRSPPRRTSIQLVETKSRGTKNPILGTRLNRISTRFFAPKLHFQLPNFGLSIIDGATEFFVGHSCPCATQCSSYSTNQLVCGLIIFVGRVRHLWTRNGSVSGSEQGCRGLTLTDTY